MYIRPLCSKFIPAQAKVALISQPAAANIENGESILELSSRWLVHAECPFRAMHTSTTTYGMQVRGSIVLALYIFEENATQISIHLRKYIANGKTLGGKKSSSSN